MPNGDRPARELTDYLEILRRRGRLVVAVFAVTIGMAAAYSINQETVYRSTMKLVVGQGQGIFSAEFGNAAEEFTQTMSDLLESQVVAETVIDRLDIDKTPANVLGNLNVVTKPATSVLEVAFDDTSRVRGREILAEVGDVFTELVDERLARATAPGNNAVAVSATVFDPAHFVPGQVRPTPMRTLAIALVLGLLLGLVAALVREQFDDTIRSLEGAERAFGQPVAATLPPHFTHSQKTREGKTQDQARPGAGRVDGAEDALGGHVAARSRRTSNCRRHERSRRGRQDDGNGQPRRGNRKAGSRCRRS
jgi:succinoglycan biosynthesis transport protein ExoP